MFNFLQIICEAGQKAPVAPSNCTLFWSRLPARGEHADHLQTLWIYDLCSLLLNLLAAAMGVYVLFWLLTGAGGEICFMNIHSRGEKKKREQDWTECWVQWEAWLNSNTQVTRVLLHATYIKCTVKHFGCLRWLNTQYRNNHKWCYSQTHRSNIRQTFASCAVWTQYNGAVTHMQNQPWWLFASRSLPFRVNQRAKKDIGRWSNLAAGGVVYWRTLTGKVAATTNSKDESVCQSRAFIYAWLSFFTTYKPRVVPQ